ncbi:MAG TPA: 3-deoxy-manno-octulosonate cytidylyltransferase [Nitrospirota bacterium]|nr:3-deoxy-manno-octulosonate cytidylyltransferase [Nitrospirota bacterium]
MTTRNDIVIAVIPARYSSTRFPGKSLVPIRNKPMIQWVYERTRQSSLIQRVVVATDDERIAGAVAAFGGEAVMTSSAHETGTDRIAEVARSLNCDLIVNVQGDEPLIRAEMIDEAVRPLTADRSIPMGTLCRRIESSQEAFDPNVVKVVFDRNGFALYFSRAPVPWNRDRWAGKASFAELTLDGPLYKHIGLYVYRREFLLNYAALPQTRLEQTEKLEQLRALEYGHRIMVSVTEHESFGVDIPDDLSKILRQLEQRQEWKGL